MPFPALSRPSSPPNSRRSIYSSAPGKCRASPRSCASMKRPGSANMSALPSYIYDHATPRARSTPSHTAFLKVSEGCDHKCAFCIIPQLRGPHRSRSIESVVTETHQLAQAGVKEINLIAQDLTAYGRDRKDGTTLYRLLREMSQVDDLQWIRLLYSYPNFLDPELLDLIANSGKICKYIDIPFQHISHRLLQRMRRGKSGSAVRETVEKAAPSDSGIDAAHVDDRRLSRRNRRGFRRALGFCRRSRIRPARGFQILRGRRHQRRQARRQG